MGAHRSPATVFRKISISIPRGRVSRSGDSRERERDGKKEELPATTGWSSIQRSPCPHPLSTSANPFIPRSLPTRRSRTCLFLQFARRPTIRFPGVVRLPYKCKARERSGLDPPVQTARKYTLSEEWPRGPPTPASYNSPFSYLISSTPPERVRLNMHGECFYDFDDCGALPRKMETGVAIRLLTTLTVFPKKLQSTVFCQLARKT